MSLEGTTGSQGIGVVSNSWLDRVLLAIPYVKTLMSTDVQAPLLGTPLVPLKPIIASCWGARRAQATMCRVPFIESSFAWTSELQLLNSSNHGSGELRVVLCISYGFAGSRAGQWTIEKQRFQMHCMNAAVPLSTRLMGDRLGLSLRHT